MLAIRNRANSERYRAGAPFLSGDRASERRGLQNHRRRVRAPGRTPVFRAMKTQFHRDIDAIVQQVISEDTVRVCGGCEKEFGPMKTTGEKSHGYCRRHFIEQMRQTMEMAQEMGQQELVQSCAQKIKEAEARPDESFAPDLAQHPDLVDHAGRADYERMRADTQRENEARLQAFRSRA